jgi:hypothetical protein
MEEKVTRREPKATINHGISRDARELTMTIANNEATAANLSLLTHELAPADYLDPVIEVFKKDVDRTLLRENLKLSVEQRVRKAQSFHASLDGWRGSGNRARGSIKGEKQR